MLQRIQSLWLACSAVLALLSVRFPVFSGNLPDGAMGKQWVALNAVQHTGLMILTAILSGVFGMAGGLILIGVLLVLMPLPQAMVLHAITQMASNGWRAVLWRQHIEWRIAAASRGPLQPATVAAEGSFARSRLIWTSIAFEPSGSVSSSQACSAIAFRSTTAGERRISSSRI